MDKVYDEIYCYKNSNVLKNKLNIQKEENLKKAETQIVMVKLYMLYEKLRNTDISSLDNKIYEEEYFKSIHEFLFRDIYEFAGKYRKVNISKGAFSFAECMYLEESAKYTFKKLKKEFKDFKEMKFEKEEIKKEKLAELITENLTNLNVLHPFREGNGRSTREYFRQIAYYNGYILSFLDFTENEILTAMKLAVLDESKLKNIVLNSLYKR